MTRLRAALLTALGVALVRPALLHALTLLLPETQVAPLTHAVSGAVLSLLTFGAAALLLLPWKKQGQARMNRGISLTVAVLSAVMCRAALTPVDAAWQTALALAPRGLPLPETPAQTALYALLLGVIPAVTEETFFRGALMGELSRKTGRAVAIILTALLFALMHTGTAELPSRLTVSLLLTLLMHRTGDVLVPLAAHIAYNLTALAPVTLPWWASLLCGLTLAGVMTWAVTVPRGKRRGRLSWQDALIAGITLTALAAQHLM